MRALCRPVVQSLMKQKQYQEELELLRASEKEYAKQLAEAQRLAEEKQV